MPKKLRFQTLCGRRGLRQDHSGTAMLELVIILPALLVIGLGVIEFGNLIFQRHMIENGVRDAARFIAGMPGCGTPDEAVRKQDGADLATYGEIRRITGNQNPNPDPPLRVPGWSLATTDITCGTVSQSQGTLELRGDINGDIHVVRIRTEVQYGNMDLGLLGVLDELGVGFSTLSFPVIHEERVYGNR